MSVYIPIGSARTTLRILASKGGVLAYSILGYGFTVMNSNEQHFVSKATHKLLVDQGLIKKQGHAYGDHVWTITDAGRAALAAPRDEVTP